jgi:hypothetical protein
MFFKKTVVIIGFDARTVDFLVEHKRLTKIGVKRKNTPAKDAGITLSKWNLNKCGHSGVLNINPLKKTTI